MRYIILCFIVYSSTTFSGLALDKKDSVDYSRTGDYFPYVVLTEEDSIFYPITYEVELFVNDLYDLDIKLGYHLIICILVNNILFYSEQNLC